MPPVIDYHTPKTRERSRFWPELWSEIRSEFSEIPVWLLCAVGGLLLTMIGGFFYIAYIVSNA